MRGATQMMGRALCGRTGFGVDGDRGLVAVPDLAGHAGRR
jgi:hypothetical protein